MRCLSKDGKSYTSAYNKTGKSITYKKPASATTTSGVAVDTTNFPDSAFRSYVSKNIDKDGNGKLSTAECTAVTAINVDGSNVATLQGIEHFTNLDSLSCSNEFNSLGKKLTELDVSKNTKLQTLNCAYNSLKKLDVSKNPALKTLDCDGNGLTMLDVSGAIALETLESFDNQLTTLDASKNTALDWLDCDSNVAVIGR